MRVINADQGELRLYMDLYLPSPSRDDLIYEVCASDSKSREVTITRKIGLQNWSNGNGGATLTEQDQHSTIGDRRQRLRIVDIVDLSSNQHQFLFLRVILN